MANPEHLEVLKQGVEQWNKWREEHPDVRPDLSDADIEKTDLRSANLRKADLSEANFREADLYRANFSGAHLRGADLSGANLREADLGEADLASAYLSASDLSAARLWGADFSKANLSGADLSDADLSRANLSGANLSDADLMGANLWRANLNGADFTMALTYATNFADVDLSAAKGLEAIYHVGPSTIGIDTIYKSGGKIPEVFLRGCGVPDNFIKYMHSLARQAFEFYSCFISYSSRDQEFAERLHADLQAKGVRCWFAPEDLKIGDKFQDRLEESIQSYDKLLLVLSENSLQSPWVEREVQAAFEREQRNNKLVLFPIRLDEAVMETPRAWAADIRRTRHIGEFNRWRDHDSYKRALERLLRDLTAETAATA